ncbi:MAG: hypothetical protein U0457_12655 [Candidatus Sericytochromatia bacterium]
MEKTKNQILCNYVKKSLNEINSDLKIELGKSNNSGNNFFKIWKDSWFYKNNGKEYSIHFEGDLSSVKLHFEVYPYVPYKKLDTSVRAFIDKAKLRLIPLIKKVQITDSRVTVLKIRSNATLTIGCYSMETDDNKSYVERLLNLINDVSLVMEEVEKVFLELYNQPIEVLEKHNEYIQSINKKNEASFNIKESIYDSTKKLILKIKNLIELERKDWNFKKISTGYRIKGINKNFIYFDIMKNENYIIRANVSYDKDYIQDYKDLFYKSVKIPDRNWGYNVIDIPLNNSISENDYFNLFQSIHDKKSYPRKKIYSKQNNNKNNSIFKEKNIIEKDIILNDNEIINNFMYPYAISYNKVFKSTYDEEKKYQYLTDFSEIVSTFRSIILLSFLNKDDLKTFIKEFFDSKRRKYHFSFGDWVKILEKTSDFIKDQNNLVYQVLSDKKNEDIFDTLSKNRNAFKHNKKTEEYDKIINHFKDFYKIIYQLIDFKLIYTINMEKENNIFEIEVDLLQGIPQNFPKEKVKIENPLDTKSLYIYNSKNNFKLKLHKELIIKKGNSIYILDSFDKNNLYYKNIFSSEENKEIKEPNILFKELFS